MQSVERLSMTKKNGLEEKDRGVYLREKGRKRLEECDGAELGMTDSAEAMLKGSSHSSCEEMRGA